jgi:hypothetical protein
MTFRTAPRVSPMLVEVGAKQIQMNHEMAKVNALKAPS